MSNAIKTVAASATNSALSAGGANGGAETVVRWLIIKPSTTAPGAVTLKDSLGNTVWTWAGGTLSDVGMKVIPLDLRSRTGFTLTTGSNVIVDVLGDFAA